jgi:hypothetical protein
MNIYTSGEMDERLRCEGWFSMAALYCSLDGIGNLDKVNAAHVLLFGWNRKSG